GDMVKKLNDIIWLLNPEQARLQQLVEKLEEYIRQLAEYKNVSVSVDIIDHISAIELPLEVRRNIYLIFKEAINNSFKYSQADSISLTIRSAEANLEFILQDDGVGFDIETVKRGNGLNNMQSRAKEIGATIRMDSAPGRGTRLSLTYRLPS
ncbi:MAG TPA: ATP-binding protein, partial [Saprospiraceae bacterium]|nr:ATP-binding protein [Saprospiraceae bacterium]